MKFLTWLAISGLSLAFTAHARIGDTMEGCVKLYGQPQHKTSDGKAFFEKDKVMIRVEFKDGKVVGIEYMAPSEKGFTVDQIMAYLMVNKGKTDWKVPQVDHDNFTHHTNWVDEGGTRKASTDKDRAWLRVYDAKAK